ncbi:MAG: hypothetical protein JST92_27700, partial [Deltaproteobacteria bacterium]|nr:hypothetical protein [Deltaproteobacteria bacterium]
IALRRALLQARKAQAPEGAAEARALLDRATRVGDELLAHPKLAKPQLVQLLTDRGDEAWSRDDLAEARARYQAALALPQPDGQRRALEARVHGLELADAAPTLRKLFIEQDTGPDTILRLRDLDLANHADGLAAYLLAKQLQNHQDWPACVTYAADALGRALPSRLFLLEALRMQAVCAIKSEQSELAERTLRLLRPMVTPGRQLELDRLRALIAPAAAPAPPPAPAPRP